MSENRKAPEVLVIRRSLGTAPRSVLDDTAKKIEDWLKALVDVPAQLTVDYQCGDRTVIFRVHCSKECIGRVLGTKGKNIGALRTMVAAIGGKHGFRAIIEVPYHPVGR